MNETPNTNSTIAVTEANNLPTAPDKIETSFTSFAPLLILLVLFYFLLIRPQEKRRKQQEQLINSVKKGEDVIILGGIYGKVVKVNDGDSTVMLEIAENTQIKVSKSSIADIVSRKKETPIVENKTTAKK